MEREEEKYSEEEYRDEKRTGRTRKTGQRGEKYSEEEYRDEKGTVRTRKTGTGRRKSEVRRRWTVIGRRNRGGGEGE